MLESLNHFKTFFYFFDSLENSKETCFPQKDALDRGEKGHGRGSYKKPYLHKLRRV